MFAKLPIWIVGTLTESIFVAVHCAYILSLGFFLIGCLIKCVAIDY